MDASSSSSPSLRSRLVKWVTNQISVDASRRDALQANLNNVSSIISRTDELTQILMSMNSTTLRDLAVMFMVDIREKDQKYVEELTKRSPWHFNCIDLRHLHCYPDITTNVV
ncbi:hypothetical protein L1987_15579 [Smallanthus sonchifolius]|uniref:Uncharacterized protein n=1 Tax=Smallanthus sonchifolius TaxID=185202 RepID=A0ACB9J861_9ASTR|nr:hypothetical protein L1987_15579 [Smallanthus sonchifolius]